MARPTVLLLHSSASSSRQWDALACRLEAVGPVQALDLYGHGRQVAWPGDRPLTLADEIALAEPLLRAAGGAHLVGHSYGGAVALQLAQELPQLVRSLTLYEPVLFSLLAHHEPRAPALREVLDMVGTMREATRAGLPRQAAHRFVDYWGGAGTWAAMAPARQSAVASRMALVVQHFGAVFGADLPNRDRLRRLPMPALCLTGERSTPAALRIGTLLRALWPAAHHETLPGLGHMGPVTHPDIVNARIQRFLAACDRSVVCSRPPWPLSCSAQERFAGHAEFTS
jgi:pimeloyl-ACP methyl ester carboxylesterase